jgi:hypothetical protein
VRQVAGIPRLADRCQVLVAATAQRTPVTAQGMQDDPAGGELDLAAPELLDPRLPVNDFLSRAQAATHLTSPVRDYSYRQYAAITAPPATME